MHVADRARLREEVRLAWSVARENNDSTSGRVGHSLRKIFPVRDRAQSLMQENKFWNIGLRCTDSHDLKAVALNRRTERLHQCFHPRQYRLAHPRPRKMLKRLSLKIRHLRLAESAWPGCMEP